MVRIRAGARDGSSRLDEVRPERRRTALLKYEETRAILPRAHGQRSSMAATAATQ